LKERFASLDVIRGFAMIGVLAVNAPFFATPLTTVANPLVGPLSVGPASVEIWTAVYVLFEYKSIAIFSMLFGASLCLVGGTTESALGTNRLFRRLWWLALFGLIHGVLLWFGDILLSYALVGLLVMRARHWPVPRLYALSGLSFAVSLLILGAFMVMTIPKTSIDLAVLVQQSWAPEPVQISADLVRYKSGLIQTLQANAQDWAVFQFQMALLLSFRTVALMMFGMAIFKSGFLTGGSSPKVYGLVLTLGALALAVLAWNAWEMSYVKFSYVRSQLIGTMITAAIAPAVALGYSALWLMLLRSNRLRGISAAFAAVGRIAFTTYLTQSIVLSTLFWSGRGLAWYGEINRAELMLIVAAIFIAQIGFAVIWQRKFGVGPFEKLWRALSYVADVQQVPGSTSSGMALETMDLSKNFGPVEAVRAVNLEVPEGSIFAFLGPNGAGKTTTIRMMLGLIKPSAGRAYVFGADIVVAREQALAQVGALLEARSTYDQLSGHDNLDITRKLLDLPPSEIERVLDLVDLRHAADRRLGHYSLGMRQRLGLARALLGRPKLLVLDEPMNGLDPDGMAQMREIIRDLPQRQNVTVLLSTHLLDEAEQVATHIGMMRNGSLLAQGSLNAILDEIPSFIEIETTDNQAAALMLNQHGITPEIRSSHIRVPAGTMQPSDIAGLVIGEGIGLRRLISRRADLDDFYHQWSKRKAA
jgi:uncharacterized protein